MALTDLKLLGTSDSPSYMDWRINNIYCMARQSGVPEEKLSEIVPYIMQAERLFTVKARKGQANL